MLPVPSMAMTAPGKAGHCIFPTQGLQQDPAAGRPVPASLSNCRDNCHKSNCSCWITSILHHHHPQLPRASSKFLFQGWKAAPLSQKRPNQAGSGHLEQSPHAEALLITMLVCQAALLLCTRCSVWCPWFWAMPLQTAGFVTASPRCSIRQICSVLPGPAAGRDHSECHPHTMGWMKQPRGRNP